MQNFGGDIVNTTATTSKPKFSEAISTFLRDGALIFQRLNSLIKHPFNTLKNASQ